MPAFRWSGGEDGEVGGRGGERDRDRKIDIERQREKRETGLVIEFCKGRQDF